MLRQPHITPGTPDKQITQIQSYLTQLVYDLEYELEAVRTQVRDLELKLEKEKK